MIIKRIQEEFNEKFLFVDVSVEDIRKKINNLRTQFFAELNKVKKSMVSGTSADDIYIPTLWCFDQLAFLDVGNPVRQSESNLLINETEMPNNELEPQELLYEGTVEELNEGAVSQVTSPLGSPLARPASASWKSEESSAGPPSKKRKQVETHQTKAVSLMERATELLVQANQPVLQPAPPDTIDAFLV